MNFTDKEKEALKVLLSQRLIKVDPITGECDATKTGEALLRLYERMGITTDKLKKLKDELEDKKK